MTDAALQTGFIFERWRKIVNAMIEMIPGRPQINKLRVIHLLEADLNLAPGIIWSRRLLQQGEKLGAFGDEQWGSRNGRSASTVVLLKHFTYEMIQLSKTDGATFDNDAKACFDRVIPALTNLRSRQLGVSAAACHTHAELLQKATNAVKTQAGISEQTYCSSEEEPLYGEGQGTRWPLQRGSLSARSSSGSCPKR
jgi:hypothetical protein